MTQPARDGLPIDIWLQIAFFLSISEVCRLALLSRPFAALAYETRRRKLLISTSHQTFTNGGTAFEGSSFGIAHEIGRKLEHRITAGETTGVRRVIFFSLPPPKAPEKPTPPQSPRWFSRRAYPISDYGHNKTHLSIFRGLKKALKAFGGDGQDDLLSDDFASNYHSFTSVESLDLLHNSRGGTGRRPRCLLYMNIPTMWTTWADNLRVLSISVDDTHTLKYYMPEGDRVTLPRLEVFRFAFLVGSWHYLDDTAEEPQIFPHLARMIATAKNSLHTIQLKFFRYALHKPPLIPTLLATPASAGPFYQRLHALSVITEQFDVQRVEVNLTLAIAKFLSAHRTTLRDVSILGFAQVVDDVLLPQAPIFHRDMRLSLRLDDIHQVRNLAEGWTVDVVDIRRLIVDLQCVVAPYEATRNLLKGCMNLRRLEISCPSLTVRWLADIARMVPQLVCLSVHHEKGWLTAEPELISRDSPPVFIRSLKHWNLKDLDFYTVDLSAAKRIESTLQMRRIASLVPAVESFCGRGHMCEMGKRPWDDAWVWKRNPYVHPLRVDSSSVHPGLSIFGAPY
ncbi:hypothetical protein BKA62DRAFT_714940 [Auriculariales sp. MPI-PUGE-AT-0066]|nr:hypothetical protein BKA62DRAFT_714940 [Auriculariales sp. MPI-PUGE-AT-0066]